MGWCMGGGFEFMFWVVRRRRERGEKREGEGGEGEGRGG